MINKLYHNIQEPAQSVHIVPYVQHSLLSTGKMADADYIGVYTKHEVNFYDAQTAIIIVTEESGLKGWQCASTGLWLVPLVEKTKQPQHRYTHPRPPIKSCNQQQGIQSANH